MFLHWKKRLPLAVVVAGAFIATPASSGAQAPNGYESPEADAGPDQTVYEDQTVTLTGSATGTEPLDYWWDLDDGRGFSVHDRTVSNLDYDAIGTFHPRLRVSDLWDGEAIDDCAITVLPRRHCSMTAAIAAQPNSGDPALGAYRYTITVNWGCTTWRPRTNLYFETFWLLDAMWASCACGDFATALRWVNPVGSSLPDCVVDYEANLLCDGTPVLGGGGGGRSIGVVPLARTCAEDSDGTAHFEFYADPAPAAQTGRMAFWEEEANVSYTVEVQGDFPMLPCGTVSAPPATWSALKTIYR